MSKTIKELNLEDDFLFAKVMSDRSICKEVIESILNLNSKGVRLDVYVKDENNTIYNIDMQRGKNSGLPKRFRYYQGSIDLDLISKGEDYQKLKKSYVIFLCTFDLFGKGRHVYTFENICLEDKELKLKDESYKIVLNTRGIINDANVELLEFLNYVEQSSDEAVMKAKGNLVKHIHERVKKIKNNVEMEVEYMTLLERDREKMREGEYNKALKDAESFLKLGVSEEIVAKGTELPLEKVLEIKKKILN